MSQYLNICAGKEVSGVLNPSTVQCFPPAMSSSGIQEVNKNFGYFIPASADSPFEIEVGICGYYCSKPFLHWHHKDYIYRRLKYAVAVNNLREVRAYLDLPGINVNWELESGDRLLHIAVHYGYTEGVGTLLQHGALPEMKNRFSISPLELAIQLNLLSIFEALLDHVCNINHMFDNGNTILHEIASKGTSSLMKAALRFKPKVDLKNKYGGYTALHLASESGDLQVVTDLIKAGADVNIVSKSGETCLQLAVENGHSSILSNLLPKVNIYFKEPVTKFSALHTAAYRGDCDCIKVLLKYGHDVNIKAYKETTPLHEAAQKGHIAAVNLLLASRAQPNVVDKHKYTPLHYAAQNGFAEIVKSLLDYGAEINAQNCYGVTPRKLAKIKSRFSVNLMLKIRGGLL